MGRSWVSAGMRWRASATFDGSIAATRLAYAGEDGLVKVLDPATGDLVLDNIEIETHRVMQNLRAILDASGSSLQQVLKATVFVKDINMFSRINAVYGEYFLPEFAPARELVQVSELPKFVNVEISVIAGC